MAADTVALGKTTSTVCGDYMVSRNELLLWVHCCLGSELLGLIRASIAIASYVE